METGSSINTIRTDNGGEYNGKDLEVWLKEKGIKHETSVPRTPEQNGVAERLNRTILECSRSILHSSNLYTEMWTEATSCAVYILNCVYSKSAPAKKTPYELWTGRKPSLAHLRIFGSNVFVHVPKEERSKFEPKSIKCIHVGYSETQKAFRVFDPVARKVRVSRDVIFVEDTTPTRLLDGGNSVPN